MTVGNLIALRQTNIVRMLAYSSIAQAGYILVPFAVAGENASSLVTAQKASVRLPAHLHGDEPRRLRRGHCRRPQNPVGRDLELRRPVHVRARPHAADDGVHVQPRRHPAARRLVRQAVHVQRRARRRHRSGDRARRHRRRELGDRAVLLRVDRPRDVDEPGARRRRHADPRAAGAWPRRSASPSLVTVAVGVYPPLFARLADVTVLARL